MGLGGIAWSGVTTFLTDFFGSPVVSGALTGMIALGLGGFALKVIIDAFRR